jgi:IPT/TIG domain
MITGIVPQGAGSGFAVSVVVGGQSNVFMDRNFTFAHPQIDSVHCPGTDGVVPPSGFFPSGERVLVVISGSNFGSVNSSSLLVTYSESTFGQIIAVSGCVRTDNHSSIICPMPAGIGTQFAFTVSVSGLSSNSSFGEAWFSLTVFQHAAHLSVVFTDALPCVCAGSRRLQM